ncbi:MAG TPA: HAMP domain-containing sensor histidine kinase [Candidatus Limnocylindria bacterium]|nr:HAMP domain-containing sensor histidine kinase [Candidatus Limnocylindria bacterium]
MIGWTAVWLGVVAVVGWIDLITGPDYGFGFFYLIAVVPAAWMLGRWPGIVVALASGAAWFIADLVERRGMAAPAIAWNASSRTFMFVVAAILVNSIRRERERLQHLDRERSLFMRVLEHELPQPSHELGEALRRLRDAGGATAEDLGPLVERAEDLEFLSREFVVLGQLQSGALWLQHGPVNVRALMEDIRSGAGPSRARLPITLSSGPFVVEGDDGRLRQALSALVGLARASTESDVSLDLRVNGGEACLTISAGVGPFLATPPDDGGVGIELARMIIDAHHGSLEVRREAASKALRLSVRLPLAG